MSLWIYGLIWIITAIILALFFGRFMANQNKMIKKMFLEEFRRQREFNEYMNRQLHQTFNRISKKKEDMVHGKNK